MKVPYLNRAKSLSWSVFTLMATMFFSFSSFAQDGSPDLYLPLPLETVVEELALEEKSYIYEDEFYSDEELYEEDQVQEDTASVSMLTFNFLFYIVYKLKFSEDQNKEEQSKTADD